MGRRTFTGLLTVSAGTLAFGDYAGSGSIAAAIANDGAIVFDIDEMRTINVMAKVGLVPTLRHHVDEARVDEHSPSGRPVVTRRARRHG